MLKQVSCAIAAAAAGTLIAGMPGHAQVKYSQDSITDGVEGSLNGAASPYELYGTGYKQEGNQLIVGISSNLPFGGQSVSGVENGTIAWGDMFFNFSPTQTFEDALADGHVYGVRFDAANDSTFASGVYKVDGVKSVTGINNGFTQLSDYVSNGGTVNPMLGDVYDLDDPSFNYLPQNKSDNIIASTKGSSLGQVTELNAADLSGYGFDFASNLEDGKTGSHSYGFKFDISNLSLPGRKFIAHLWAECFNEGTAFEGEVASVPEPTSVLALAVVGGVAWARKRKANDA